MKKTCIFTLIILITNIMLSGCYDLREIDDLAYVMVIGLDKGKTNELKMTLEFATPNSGTGGKEEGGGKERSITVIECPTIYSGFNMVNNYLSKEINLSHARAIIFSEDLAMEGIEKYLHAIFRGREFRGDMHIAISRGLAENFIKNTEPSLEMNPAKHFELMLTSHKYTGLTPSSRLINFYLTIECTCVQASATLVGVNTYESSDEFRLQDSTFKNKERELPMEGDYKAGDLPKTFTRSSEVMGMAVFDGAKMVGSFDGEMTTYYLMISGKFQNAYETVKDPIKKDQFVVLSMKQSRKPTHKVILVDGQPKISAKVELEADILSIQSGINYEDPEKLKILEKSTEKFLKKEMLLFLEKTRKLNVDICGFGKYLKKRTLFWDEWRELDWYSKYKDAQFNIDVSLKIRRPGLFLKSIPAESSKGREF